MELSTVKESRETNHYIIIMEDWNSMIGKGVHKGMDCVGQFGERMINFCQIDDIKIGN